MPHLRLLRTISWMALAQLIVTGSLGLIILYAGIVLNFTSPERIVGADDGGIQVLDRNGEMLFEFAGPSGGFRTPVPLNQISPTLINATIATEDANFWENPGVNLKGLARATYENVAFWQNGGLFRGPGGSSITQQLAKNLYIPPEERAERDPLRKLREVFFAFELNRRYSKEQVLEWYLNEVFYGNSAYGAEAAARRYFDKHASELTLAEAAMLAGIPKAPAVYDPLGNPEAAKARQEQVLDLMVRHGHIAPEEAQTAKVETLAFSEGHFPIRAPHFVMHVRELLPRLLGDGAPEGGLRLITSLDLSLQGKAEEAVQAHLSELGPQVSAGNGALVALDPKTGEILAMVGSRDYFDDSISGQVNNALALNQPGSSIKPITYLAAFLKGWSPATMIEDRPLSVTNGGETFVLQNPDGIYRGQVSARQALGNSLNVPAVNTLQYAGLPDVHALAQRMGLTGLQDVSAYGPSFTLGGVDAPLMDMTFAFSVLANYGEQVGMPSVLDLPEGSRPLDPVAVLRVENAKGDVLWQYEPRRERIAPAPQAYLVTNVLSDNAARAQVFGLDSALKLPDRPAAVKTGLSDGPRDTWAIGYTPQLVAGVWVGNTDNSPMPGAISSQTAAPIWHDFMVAALAGQPALAFQPPEGVKSVQVCATTGLLPTRRCKQVVSEVFAAELAPTTTGTNEEIQTEPTDEDDRRNRGRDRGRDEEEEDD